jgi:hypothetical protein
MSMQNAIGILLLLIACASVGYAIYVRVRSNSYTRERYAFAILSAEVSLVILAIHSITAKPFWAVMAGAWHHIFEGASVPEEPHHWSENVLVVILVIFVITIMNRTLLKWHTHGLTSARQRERETIHENRTWVIDAIEEARRMMRRDPPLVIYRPLDYSRSFSQIETPIETLAWHENARELITLRWRSHVFDAWHPQVNLWVGENSNTSKPIMLFCVRDMPSDSDLTQLITYVKNNLPEYFDDSEYIIAAQRGKDTNTTIYGMEIRIETENSLLSKLVDFTDYFNEIKKRVTEDYLPDSTLTISDVYVPPFGTHEIENRQDRSQFDGRSQSDGEHRNGFELDEFLETWSDEQSGRQLALLGEYGQGKSTVALKYTFDRIQLAQEDKSRIPILIELRGKSPSSLQPLELLGAWASAYRIEPKSLLKLVVCGRVILIFEGFDEMAEAGDLESRLSHLRSLWRLCYPRSKFIITGRPNFFLDDAELKVALGISERTGTGHYGEAIYLRFFEEAEIVTALRSTDPETKRQILDLYKKDKKFREIVSRPSLLYIVALLWKERLAKETNIDSARVLDLFIRHIYLRQALKANADRTFMLLSVAEREYFMDGIAAYMVAKSLGNQIMPEQFHDSVTKLYTYIPETLFKKGAVTELDRPSRPLAERMKGRPRPLEDIETDARTFGILVRDYSRPGALRFPHKSFFELIFAKHVAENLIGQNREERSSIAAATSVRIESVMDMPESIAFLGELLQRGRAGKSGEPATLNSLFNSIVLANRIRFPNVAIRVVLLEFLSRRAERGILAFFLSPSNILMVLFTMLPAFYFVGHLHEFASLKSPFDLASAMTTAVVGPVAIAAVTVIALALSVGALGWGGRIRLWRLVILHFGYSNDELRRAFGKRVASLIKSDNLN